MPIRAVVGFPGAGKTYFMTRAAYRMRCRDPHARIFSNYPLYLPGDPVPVVESIEDCYGLENCTLFLDELHLWASSREWSQHRGEFAEWCSQLRKVDVDMWYCSQALGGVEKLLRDRTFVSYFVESFKLLGFFVYSAFIGEKPDKKNVFHRGVYRFKPKIAACYWHKHRIEVRT